MTLFKRGHIWWAYFWIDGVRHQHSTRTRNRRHAEQIAQRLQEQASLSRVGYPALDPHVTVGGLAAHFVAANVATAYHHDRLKHLLPYFGDTPAATISKASVREYRAERHARKSVKDATINRDIAVLRHLLYWAVDEGLIATNPLARLRLPAERPIARSVITVTEEYALLGQAPTHLRALAMMALDTGMRRGELLAQRWEHVDQARRLLRVTHSKTLQGELREIPFTSRVADLLLAPPTATGLLFTYRNHPIRTVKTAWRATLRRAGIRHVRFHDLRHAFNVRLLECGVLREVRMALMGHTTGGGVHSVYTHVELPMKRDAVARLEAWHTPQWDSITNTKEDTHESTTTDRCDQDGALSAGANGHAKTLEETDRD